MARNALTTGLAAAVATTSTTVSTGRRRLRRDERAEADGEPEGERQPADRDVGDRAGGEPQRRRHAAAAEPARDQDVGEQRADAPALSDGDRPDPERRAEHREQGAVAERVVTAEPLVVPDLEAVALDEGDAEEVGREVRAAPAQGDGHERQRRRRRRRARAATRHAGGAPGARRRRGGQRRRSRRPGTPRRHRSMLACVDRAARARGGAEPDRGPTRPIAARNAVLGQRRRPTAPRARTTTRPAGVALVDVALAGRPVPRAVGDAQRVGVDDLEALQRRRPGRRAPGRATYSRPPRATTSNTPQSVAKRPV